MPDFKSMKALCNRNRAITKRFVDDFLLIYADKQDCLVQRIMRQLVDFHGILSEMLEGWAGGVISQVIAHQLFMKGGLAGKYLHHIEVQKRSDEELEYLKFQIDYPWQFSYCSIVKQACKNFYEMKDVLSGDVFILNSSVVTKLLSILGIHQASGFC